MGERSILVVIALLLGMLILVSPASAVKVYVNPSIQTGNVSPDGQYNEGNMMQDVASRLVGKLQARGFDVRSSGWLDLGPACTDANNWGASCFVALHTDSTGAGGWVSNHGTRGFFHQSSGGWHDDRNVDFAGKIVNRMVAKFNAFGRGYNLGTQADYPWCGWNMYVLAPWNQVAIPSALIEGLYHDNYDDVHSVLLNASGRDAYAQGVFEGICDYYGWSYGSGVPTPLMLLNQDGHEEIFCRGIDGAIWHMWVQADGTWSSWVSMGGSFRGEVAGGANADGRLELFCVGNDGQMYTNHQEAPNSSWSGWTSLGGDWPYNPGVGLNSNGSLQVFCVGNTGNVYTKYQTTAGGDYNADWQNLSGNFNHYYLAIGKNADGRLEIFACGSDGNLYHKYKRTDGSWNGTWDSLGYANGLWPRNSDPAIGYNQDGRMQVFLYGGDGKVYYKYQTAPNSGWTTSWTNMGGTSLSRTPTVTNNADGRMEVWTMNSAGTAFKCYQRSNNGPFNGTWDDQGGTWAAKFGGGTTADGRQDLWVVGNNHYMYHKYQAGPNSGSWSGWETVGPNTIF